MDLKGIIAKITFSTHTDGRSKAHINMPVDIRKGFDDKIYITLNLFGGMQTFAENEDGIDEAINEAIQIFFMASSQIGKGVQEELASLGWQIKKNSVRFKSFTDRKPVANSKIPLSSSGVSKNWVSKAPLAIRM
jgi:hypothetical protein